MRFLCLLVLGSVSAVNFGEDTEWEMFKSRFRKKYDDHAVEQDRRQMYLQNKAAVAEHNAKFAAGLVTFRMSLNKFADMHPEEVKSIHYGYRQKTAQTGSGRRAFSRVKSSDIPTSLDWRDKGAVTAVKDQGSCGACWAFSATGSIEGQVFLATDSLVSLSEEELIDCSDSEGNEGCNGGNMDDAFEYVISNGVTTESCYPFTGKDGTCLTTGSCWQAKLSSYTDLPSGDENALLTAVATIGPISVGIDAPDSFQYYAGGIYDEASCGSTSADLNHAVLLIGYGTSGGTPYWLIKNSWGTSWGESGYGLMSRNKSNQCGIATMASYPVVSSNLTYSAADRPAMCLFVFIFILLSKVLLHRCM